MSQIALLESTARMGYSLSVGVAHNPTFLGIRHSVFVIHSGIRVSALLRHSEFDFREVVQAGQMPNDKCRRNSETRIPE
jgi:hypothetical protein